MASMSLSEDRDLWALEAQLERPEKLSALLKSQSKR